MPFSHMSPPPNSVPSRQSAATAHLPVQPSRGRTARTMITNRLNSCISSPTRRAEKHSNNKATLEGAAAQHGAEGEKKTRKNWPSLLLELLLMRLRWHHVRRYRSLEVRRLPKGLLRRRGIESRLLLLWRSVRRIAHRVRLRDWRAHEDAGSRCAGYGLLLARLALVQQALHRISAVVLCGGSSCRDRHGRGRR